MAQKSSPICIEAWPMLLPKSQTQILTGNFSYTTFRLQGVAFTHAVVIWLFENTLNNVPDGQNEII